MENTRQRKHLYKQAGIWLVALFVVLTAAFMRGKVNVKAAETDDITITRYVDGREQTDSWTGGEWEYTVGDSINLSVKVEGISDTTNLKYKWRYAGKVVSESTGGTESSVTITKECGEDSPDCVISNGDEEIDTVWFTLETTETLEVFRPTLFIDGEKAPETTEDDGNSEYSWDDSINLQLGQELKIKLNVESSYDAKNISYEWYQQDEDGWYNDKISDENGGNTDAVTVKKQKYGKERYRCEVTDGNQKEDLYITIPEVKTLSVIKKVNGEVYKSGMEGIRGKKYTLKVDAESVYKDENGKTNITYKWYQGYDEENIQGKTDTLEIELDSEGASYACEVSDGNSVKEYPFSQLRTKVGMVPQQAVLFKGTIRDNMKWGKEDASEEEIQRALSIAQASGFVKSKPEGLNTMVSQGGANLSGGQRQRLTIARALVGDPEILIMDDSASALDFATDAALRHAIHEQTKGMTVFIVSQRATSIKQADKILVLDDGELAGVGTHKELMESCEVYREICLSQLSEQEVNR